MVCLFPDRFITVMAYINSICTRPHISFSKTGRSGCCSPDQWRTTCQKYWVGKPKYWEGEKGDKSEKCMGVSQLLGARVRTALPKSTPMLPTIQNGHLAVVGTSWNRWASCPLSANLPMIEDL